MAPNNTEFTIEKSRNAVIITIKERKEEAHENYSKNQAVYSGRENQDFLLWQRHKILVRMSKQSLVLPLRLFSSLLLSYASDEKNFGKDSLP